MLKITLIVSFNQSYLNPWYASDKNGAFAISGKTEDELLYEFNKLRKLLYMTHFTLDWSHV